MKVAGVFSGIGMLKHAAHQFGYETLWMCENDDFCRKVLTKRFPEAHLYGDVKEVVSPAPVDLLVGGF